MTTNLPAAAGICFDLELLSPVAFELTLLKHLLFMMVCSLHECL